MKTKTDSFTWKTVSALQKVLLAPFYLTETKQKNRIRGCGFRNVAVTDFSPDLLALARFEAALGLVDHIYAALATHNAAVTVPVLERAERVLDLHGPSPVLRREPAPGLAGVPIRGPEQ